MDDQEVDRRRADGAIAAVAATQYGVFSRAQARGVGLSDRQLRYRIERGRIERLTRHTFRIVGAAESWRQRLMAACLAAGDGAAVSHRSAAALHRYDGFPPGLVEITVGQGRRDFHLAGVIVHSSSCWADEDITVVDGIPVTTPERTLVTLAATSLGGAGRERARQRRTRPHRPPLRRRRGPRRRPPTRPQRRRDARSDPRTESRARRHPPQRPRTAHA